MERYSDASELYEKIEELFEGDQQKAQNIRIAHVMMLQTASQKSYGEKKYGD
jgi:hypothetical protein